MDGMRQTDHFERSVLSFPGKWMIDKLGNKDFQVDNNLKGNLNRKVTGYITSIQVPTRNGITGGHLCPRETDRTQHQLNQVPEHVAVAPVSSTFSAMPQETLKNVAGTSSASAVLQLEHVTVVPYTTGTSSASAIAQGTLEHVTVVPNTTGTSSASTEPQETLGHVLVSNSLDTISGSAVVEHDKSCEVNDSKTEFRLLETSLKVRSRYYQADAGEEEQEDYSSNLQNIKTDHPHAANTNLCILSPNVKSPNQHQVSLSHSDDVVDKYLCDLCMMSYPSIMLLNDHLSSHSGTQLYKCLICEKGFEEIYSLHQHMLTHTNLPESFLGLPRAASNQDSLTGFGSYYKCFSDTNQHRLRLTDLSAVLSCQVCDFTCQSKDKLRHHLLSHRTISPYPCSLCDFSCASKQLLIRHMMSHMSDEDSADASDELRSRNRRNLKKKVLVRKDWLKSTQKVDKTMSVQKVSKKTSIQEVVKQTSLQKADMKMSIKFVAKKKSVLNVGKETRNTKKKCWVNKSYERNNALKLKTKLSTVNESSLQKCDVNRGEADQIQCVEGDEVNDDAVVEDDELDDDTVVEDMETEKKQVVIEAPDDVKCDKFDPIEEALIEGRIKDPNLTFDPNTVHVDKIDQTQNSEDFFQYQPETSQLTCKHCQHVCESFAYLKRHMNTHTDLVFESCPHCEFFCRTDKQMREHMVTHSDPDADKRPFHCSQCDLSFKTRADLKRHFVTHLDISKLMCKVCSFSCSKQSRLEQHWKRHTNYKAYSCTMCQYVCSSKTTLNNHMKKHCTGKDFNCRFCDFKALSQPLLRKHLRLDHADQRPYACELCPFTCWLINDLRKHEWIHAGIKPYQCDQCEYSCRRRNRLREHMMIHKNFKPFRCKKCSHACRTKHHLKKHFASHINEEDLNSATGLASTSKAGVDTSGQMTDSNAEPLIKQEEAAENGDTESSLIEVEADNKPECFQVKQKIDQFESLNVHFHLETKTTASSALSKGYPATIEALLTPAVFQRKRNEKGRRKMNCSVCSYTCRKLSHLKRHLSTHINDRPFKCDSCDYTSKTAVNLRRHAKRHSGMKPFSCKLCAYSCYELGDMNHHLLIHTDFKAYKCTQCNYAARKKYHLKEHLLTHSDVKPFLCAECGESMRSNAKLKEHMIRHTTEKNIKCSQCMFTCRLQCELVKHMRRHEDVEADSQRIFLCPECGLSFKLNAGLKQHLLTHSKEKPYFCTRCSFRCRTKGQLKSHMTVHLQGKPFTCEYCSFTSKHESSLRRHKQGHTCTDLIPCPLCSLKFVRKYDLRRHLANKHKSNVSRFTLVDTLRYSNPGHADKDGGSLSSTSLDLTGGDKIQ